MIPAPAIVAGGNLHRNVLTALPGNIFEFKDGTRYVVSKSGAWVRSTRKRFDDRAGLTRAAAYRLGKLVRG